MRRGCAGLLVLLAATAAVAAFQAAPPGTDIYLSALTITNGAVTIGAPVNISNSPGYDNQPSFLPDSSALLFTSQRDGKQTDIYRYDIKAKVVSQLTHTDTNEYSPLVTPDGKTFSTVRGDKQELWRFDLDGSNPRLAYAHAGLIGYHVWIDDHRLAVFVLGAGREPATLQLIDAAAKTADVIDTGIGQSLLMRPKHGTVSYISRQAGQPAVIKELDPATKQTKTIVDIYPGAQYLTWLPDGGLLAASGTKVALWREGASGWTDVADLASSGLSQLTRLAASPDGKWLALVANDPPKK